jgi:hypothetical protein
LSLGILPEEKNQENEQPVMSGQTDFDYFERLASDFVCSAVKKVPGHLAALVFASPLCARSPDLCLMWHPRYRERHKKSLIVKLCFQVLIDSLKGIVKYAFDLRPFEYALYGKIGESILVVPSICGSEVEEGGYTTSYVDTKTDDALFVFGGLHSCGRQAERIKRTSLRLTFTIKSCLFRSGMHAISRSRGNLSDRILLLIVWSSWVLSLRWLYEYCLGEKLAEVVESHQIKKIGCIHEMHPYSRVVWKVASKYHAAGYTVQHAAISSGKRWYFCFPEEKRVGLVLPDVMYIYNHEVVKMLKAYYQDTVFILGCSSRYSHWKTVRPLELKTGNSHLFVSGISSFDLDPLLTLVGILIRSNKDFPIRLRIHPAARLSFGKKLWLNRYIKKGMIEISKNTNLLDDIQKSIAVIGGGSGALEEALFLGRPVIQIIHPDYLQYLRLEGVKGTIKRDFREFSAEDLTAVLKEAVDTEAMRNRLGIDQPVVDYDRLFSENVA